MENVDYKDLWNVLVSDDHLKTLFNKINVLGHVQIRLHGHTLVDGIRTCLSLLLEVG